MPEEPMVVGIDIGTYLTKVVVAKKIREDLPPSVVTWGTSLTEGMRKGAVIDEDDVAQSVNQALKEVKDVFDEEIEEVYVSIGGSHLGSIVRKEKIAVSRADTEVSPDDVERLKDHVSRHTSSRNRELLKVVERSYFLDDTAGIHDPVGMHGIRLELEGVLIEGNESAIRSHDNVFEKTQLQVLDRQIGILMAGEAVLSKKQKELGVVVVDIGAATTSIVVYEERTIIHLAVISIGAAHITNDLAIGLKTSIDIAEHVKIKYGYASPEYIPDNRTNRVQLSEFSSEETASFPIEFVSEVIEARMQEIFQFVNQELANVEREGLLPPGAVLTSGGANTRGITALAKDELDIPAKVGEPGGIEGDASEVKNPAFATTIGLILYGMSHEDMPQKRRSFGQHRPKLPQFLGKMTSGIKEWFQKLFPE
ncbi:MAG: cell division protein FtsA [Candidatus Paceibacteria bacterium]